MRAGSGLPLFAGFHIGRPCPCCFGSLEAVKHAMRQVSAALAEPLPSPLRERVAPALDAVRAAGRLVLADLAAALRGQAPPPSTTALRDAIAAFERAVDGSEEHLASSDAAEVGSLQYSLRALDEALAALTAELGSIGSERHATSAFICDFVERQQIGVDICRK